VAKVAVMVGRGAGDYSTGFPHEFQYQEKNGSLPKKVYLRKEFSE